MPKAEYAFEVFAGTTNDLHPKSRSRCFDIGIWGGCGTRCGAFVDGECPEPQEIRSAEIIAEHGEEDAQQIINSYPPGTFTNRSSPGRSHAKGPAMSADRELLELAAKAYWASEIDDVVSVEWNDESQSIIYTHASIQDYNGNDWALLWNPLTDDGDALRLAVKLGISVAFLYGQLIGGFKRGVSARHMDIEVEEWGDDIEDATRRAIVRAAAEIGKAKP